MNIENNNDDFVCFVLARERTGIASSLSVRDGYSFAAQRNFRHVRRPSDITWSVPKPFVYLA
jgi:hypothetical protein